MKKYKTPTIKPHMLKIANIMAGSPGRIGNEGYQDSETTIKYDDED